MRQPVHVTLFFIQTKGFMKPLLGVKLKGVLDTWGYLMLSNLARSPCYFESCQLLAPFLFDYAVVITIGELQVNVML